MDDLMDYTEVYVWGSSARGQLGVGADQPPAIMSPVTCSLGFLIRELACGEEHTLLLTEGMQVYALGSNADGQLGIGDASVKEAHSPVLLKDLSQLRITGIASGSSHSVAITAEGQAFAWGKGDCGALGTGAADSEWSPQAMKLPPSMRVRQVSCGARHTAVLAITSESKGTLLTCGSGELGQLGTGLRSAGIPTVLATDGEVKQVSCGVVHTAFTTYLGKVYAVGANSLGQLGTGNKVAAKTPGRVRTLEGVFVEKVACGNHTAALSDKGELYIWGTGPFGEKLLPWRVPTPVPLRDLEVGGCFGAAIDISKRVWTWGTNANGELGQGDFKQRKALTLVQALGRKAVKTLACGSNFVVALGVDVRTKQSKQSTRDQSPLSRFNLPLVRSRQISELTTPKSNREFLLESPVQLKAAGSRSPSEFIFSPRKDPEAIPEASEFEQSEETRPRPATNLYIKSDAVEARVREERKTDIQSQGEKLNEELTVLRGKLLAAENAVSALNGKVIAGEREVERLKAENRESDARLRAEVETLRKQLTSRDEELTVAVGARVQVQAAYDRLSASHQQLARELQDERAAKGTLLGRVQSLEEENQRMLSEYQQLSVSRDTLSPSLRFVDSGSVRQVIDSGKGQKPALPQLNLELLSKAKSRKERTIRLLNSVTPPEARSRNSSKEDDLNMRYDELEDSPRQSPEMLGHAREYSQSVASLSDVVTQDYCEPTKGQPKTPELPQTDRKPAVRDRNPDTKPRLRSNVSDLKYKLKALRDNQPALESKISAFERRLRGTMDRKQ